MHHISKALASVALVATVAVAAHAAAQVNARQTSFGRVLVDAKGHTLYLFAADRNGKSSCYGQCATYWPPLLATKAPRTGSGLKTTLFGTTARKGGQEQVTYNHHPLYRYAGDASAGQAKGQGLNVSGGLWWVVSPAGKAIEKKPASAPAYP